MTRNGVLAWWRRVVTALVRSAVGCSIAIGAVACGATSSLDELTGSAEAPAPPATRPVDKETCPEAQLTSDLPPLDRRLVPYSPTLLGVDALWGEGGNTVRIISGGYLDDVFEAYDDLEETGTAEVRGREATVLASSLLGRPVRAVVWYEDDVGPPCNAHAAIAIGLEDEAFARQLAAIR